MQAISHAARYLLVESGERGRGERGREWRVQFTPVKANWRAAVFVRVPPPRRPPPVLHRWRPGLATTAPAPTGPAPVAARFGNHRAGPHRRRVAVGSKGRRKGWGMRSFQTGLPPVQDRWGARERGIHGNQSRNGNGYARNCEIRPECDKLTTPGRESFSGNDQPHGTNLLRKRLPTPSRKKRQ